MPLALAQYVTNIIFLDNFITCPHFQCLQCNSTMCIAYLIRPIWHQLQWKPHRGSQYYCLIEGGEHKDKGLWGELWWLIKNTCSCRAHEQAKYVPCECLSKTVMFVIKLDGISVMSSVFAKQTSPTNLTTRHCFFFFSHFSWEGFEIRFLMCEVKHGGVLQTINFTLYARCVKHHQLPHKLYFSHPPHCNTQYSQNSWDSN